MIPANTRAARRRSPSKPMARDEGLGLAKLEHAITTRLAVQGQYQHCEELSAYLDRVHASERMDALKAVAA